MAFKLEFTESVNTQPVELYTVTDSEAITLGEALVLTSGKLTKCGATAVPTFIALKSTPSAATGVEIPVLRIREDMIFKTKFSADASSNNVGTKVTIDSTGLLTTATDSSGVATIVKKLGSGDTGTEVLVAFRQ